MQVKYYLNAVVVVGGECWFGFSVSFKPDNIQFASVWSNTFSFIDFLVHFVCFVSLECLIHISSGAVSIVQISLMMIFWAFLTFYALLKMTWDFITFWFTLLTHSSGNHTHRHFGLISIFGFSFTSIWKMFIIIIHALMSFFPLNMVI